MPRYASLERQHAEEQRHRREILEAAAAALVEKGLHAVTMRDVAKAARFSVGKLYLHFPNKEFLFEELLDHYVDQALVIVERVLPGPGRPAERIETVVREVLAFVYDNPLFVRLLVNETLGFELRMQAQFGRSIAAKYQRMLQTGFRVFEEGLRKGEFRSGTAEELTLKLAGIFNAVVAAESLRPVPRPVDEVAEVILRLFWEGTRA